MRMYDIIEKKKRGGALSEGEIRFFVEGYVNGSVPDYQAAALCMAIYFRGMTDEECAALTFAIRDSGRVDKFEDIDGITADKHSTGGVGDKTSLVVGPIVASLGVKVAKISGRGLGHTGGTIDKLESISGFNCNLDRKTFVQIVNGIGFSIVGQSDDLAPADKKLYALRDVTATVDSIPLIASSIMGKKLALNDRCIVLDVKCGSGAFMKTLEDSRRLARLMVNIGKADGRKIMALITNMDAPLGYAIGNSLEVIEAINTLRGNGPEDLTNLCVELAAHMLFLSGKGSVDVCKGLVRETIQNTSALQKLAQTVEAQGGDPALIYDVARFPKASRSMDVKSPKDGFIFSMDAEGYGKTALLLGAGRSRLGDDIDPTAGVVLRVKPGDRIKQGETIATLYSSSVNDFSDAAALLLQSTNVKSTAPAPAAMILDTVL